MISLHKKRFRLQRRHLLALGGLSSAGLLLPSLFTPRAQAQANTIRRLLIVVEAHGTVRESWRMRRNHAEGAFSYAFDDPDPESFSTILRPLHAHRNQLTVIEGLSQASTLGDVATNNHNAGHLHLLTGAKFVDDQTSGGPSVDQVIAQEISRPDQIPSLELSTGGAYLGGFINSAEAQRVPFETNPQSVFERVFPGGRKPDDAPPAEPSEADLILGQHGSVLDMVSNEYQAVLPRLSLEDRQKLQQHHDLLRELEQRITAQGPPVPVECSLPTEQFGDGGGNARDKVAAFASLVASAFACDRTRVATIQIQQLSAEEFGAPGGIDVHQDIAHQTNDDPVAAERMTQYNVVHAQMFATILDRLSDYNLLESTAVVWLTELANGPHELDDIPVVMAGSCGGFFKTGNYVSFAKNLPNPHEHPNWGPDAKRPIGPGHSHLLVSLMNAMGVDRNSIGEESVVTRDDTNRSIDLTGPLVELHA
jgi:hypothetical protein